MDPLLIRLPRKLKRRDPKVRSVTVLRETYLINNNILYFISDRVGYVSLGTNLGEEKRRGEKRREGRQGDGPQVRLAGRLVNPTLQERRPPARPPPKLL